MKHNNCRLTQKNWEALQQLYGNLYSSDTSDPSREFWHYTSAKGVLGIFKDYIEKNDDVFKNVVQCSMLASNIRFMNDSKEYEEGKECYKQFCKKVDSRIINVLPSDSDNPINDNIYLISFCNDGDLLSQWKWYGKNSGIAIRFNIDNIAYRTYEYENVDGKKEEFSFSDPHTKPLRVKYTEREKQEYFNTLLQHNLIRDSKAYDLLELAFIPFCKHEGFAEEKESRLVFYIGDLIMGECVKGKFDIVYNLIEEGRVKPALNVQMECYDKEQEASNIISEMIVGPGANQELVFNFLIHVFDRINYYYHKEEKSEDITWESFISKNEHKVCNVKCKDGKYREAYKCENGIVIMKSAIPFRG